MAEGGWDSLAQAGLGLHLPAGVALDLPWEPDECRGRRLLAVIMEGGNFGHETKKYKVTGWDKPWSRIGRFIRRNWYMMRDYPDEVLRNLGKRIL